MTGHVFAYNGNDGNIVNVEHLSDNVKIPIEFSLKQNYPNPFNPSTIISYQLPVVNWVTLKVFDLLGCEVVTLVNEYKQAGRYNFEFRASSAAGGFGLSNGVYFYRLTASDFSIGSGKVIVSAKKFVLIK